jgi:hypothetical protein
MNNSIVKRPWKKMHHPFTAHDLVLYYAKTLEEGNSWAIPSNLHTIGHSTPRNFVPPPTKLKPL